METQTTGIQGTLAVPDFSDAKEEMKIGSYKVYIKNATPGVWKAKNPEEGQKDIPWLNWRMETYDETNPKNNGRAIWHKTPLAGGGLFKLQQFYKAATGQELRGSFDYTALYGLTIEVTMGEQKGNPEYLEVKSVKSISV
jgi:hypothetical protein